MSRLWASEDASSSDPATTIHAATAKTPPVNADELPLVDSAAGWSLKKLTWANLKAELASVFTTGPASSTDHALTRFDGTTGKVVQNSGILISDTNRIDIPPNGSNVILGNTAHASTGLVYDVSAGAFWMRTFDGYPVYFGRYYFGIPATHNLSWNSNIALSGGGDLNLWRDEASVLAQRTGTTAQTYRLYNTYTNASNYERLALKGTTGSKVELAAESAGTGASTLDVAITPKGSGKVVIQSSAEQLRLGYDATKYVSHTVDASGNLTLDTTGGTIFTPDTIENTTAGAGIILKSPNGTRYKLTVANGGTLSITAA